MARITLQINGNSVGPHDVPDELPMIDFLNDYVGLTGTKFGCGIGFCNACIVIVDGADGTSETLRTCINSAASFDGKNVRTVEAHAKDAELSPVQDAFVRNFAFQCGYCTPGFVNAGTVLLERLEKAPVKRKEVAALVTNELGEHVCRCTGYVRYHEALRDYVLPQPKLLADG